MTDITITGRQSSWPATEDYKASFRTAWPLGASFLGTIAIGTTDIIFIGRLGADYLAASSLAMAIYLVVFLICLGMVLPATPLAAQARGARNPRRIRRVIRQGLWITATVCLPGYLALWHLPRIMDLAGQDPALTRIATDYMRFFMWVLMPAVGYAALRCFLTAMERPRAAMVVMWLAVLINIVLDYSLIFGRLGLPEMGIEGAGLASVIVNIFMFAAIVLVVMYHKAFRRYGIFQRLWRPDWQIYRTFLRQGWPIALELLAEEGLISAGTLLAGLFGPREVAAHAIALQLISIVYMVGLGFSGAASTRAGFHMGRRDLLGIRRSCLSSLFMALGFMGIFALVFTFFPHELSRIFLDPETPNADEVMALAATLLAIAAFFQITDGCQLIMAGALNGISDMLAASLIGLVCYWGIGITAAVFFGFYLEAGVVGIWWGMALGLVMAALAYMIRFYFKTRDERLFDD